MAASIWTPWHGVTAWPVARFGRSPLLAHLPKAAAEHGVPAPDRRRFAVCWPRCWLRSLVRAFFVLFGGHGLLVSLSAIRVASGDASRRSRPDRCAVLQRHWRGGLARESLMDIL